MIFKKCILLTVALFICVAANAQSDLSSFTSDYEGYTYTASNKKQLSYRILFPEDYDLAQKYPLVLFLHGSGERGSDNEQQLTHGADMFLLPEVRKEFPAIVVFPQCPKEKKWAAPSLSKKPGEIPRLVMGMLKKIVREESVDKNRIYVMGLSMGGFGTFEMLYYWPRYFSAAVPICGGHDPEGASKYAKYVPVWIFHGSEDSVVPVKRSQDMYARLKGLNAKVKYTEFPEVGHSSWVNTFALPELLPWVFSQAKK